LWASGIADGALTLAQEPRVYLAEGAEIENAIVGIEILDRGDRPAIIAISLSQSSSMIQPLPRRPVDQRQPAFEAQGRAGWIVANSAAFSC
jgi:hypothetical protein